MAAAPTFADPATAASTKVVLNQDQPYKTFSQAEPHELPSFAKFKASMEKFRGDKFKVGPITPIAISPFGPLGSAKAGFTYTHALVEYNKIADPKSGAAVQVPSLAIIRGDAVAMLIFLNVEGRDYVVLTEQPRVPIGEPNYIEIPAGMTDAAEGKTGYAAAIAREMEEEVGLKLDRTTDLIPIGRMVPSAGGCDEKITLYFSRVEADPAALTALEGRLGGALEESEQISARIMPIEEVRERIRGGNLDDAKLITALYFYDNGGASVTGFKAPKKKLVPKAGGEGVEVVSIGEGGGRSRKNRKGKKSKKTRKH